MSAPNLLNVSRHGNVTKIEMNRPPHNLLESSMVQAFRQAFEQAVKEGARAILITSGLRHFSAGADLNAAFTGELQKVNFMELLEQMENLPIPTVVAIHGLTLGGGFELALACDLVIAAKTAEVGLVEASLGLFPIMGGIARVVARAGSARAKEMVLMGRRYSAETLEKWGVINQVVDAEILEEVSMSVAQQLAAGPTKAFLAIRKIANHTVAEGVISADKLSLDLATDIWKSDDVRASLETFRETGSASAVFTGT